MEGHKKLLIRLMLQMMTPNFEALDNTFQVQAFPQS